VIKEVKHDKTLLLDGPASMLLVAGEAEILGAPLSVGKTAIIRDGKRVPIYLKNQAPLDIIHAEGFDSRGG
jgi:hypothetical protein